MKIKANTVRWLTFSSILISSLFLLAGGYALHKNEDFEAGNHSFLFGTHTGDVILKHSLLLSIVGSAPLIVPVLLKRSKLNYILVVCAIAMFIFFRFVLFVLSD